MAHRISRRTFGAGLALGLPLAGLARSALAQTPATGLVAVGPHELRDTLINRPFELTYRGYSFETSRWTDVGRTPYFSAVGGVLVGARFGGGDISPLLGAYVVYLDEVAPHSAMFHARNHYEDDTVEVIEQSVGGYDGEVIVYGTRDRANDITLVPVRNVLVIGYDTIAPGKAEPGTRSLEPATVLIQNLDEILQTPT